MNQILIGAIAMCSLTIALFFLRFWRSTRDRFFFYFSLAFLIEALHRLLFGLRLQVYEDSPALYLIRLSAYCLIIFAIIDKNRRRKNNAPER
jgi:Family of unknown function (DUF5985)